MGSREGEAAGRAGEGEAGRAGDNNNEPDAAWAAPWAKAAMAAPRMGELKAGGREETPSPKGGRLHRQKKPNQRGKTAQRAERKQKK